MRDLVSKLWMTVLFAIMQKAAVVFCSLSVIRKRMLTVDSRAGAGGLLRGLLCPVRCSRGAGGLSPGLIVALPYSLTGSNL